MHENVYSARARIAEARNEEENRLTAISENVEETRKWRLLRGEAILHDVDDPKTLSGLYIGEPGKLDLSADASGKITGELRLPNRENPAMLTGQLDGSTIVFSWKWEPPEESKEETVNTVPGFENPILAALRDVPLPSRHEHGILIVDGGKLIGYSRAGSTSFEAIKSESLTEWELEKQKNADSL